jgi:hypothetical protein
VTIRFAFWEHICWYRNSCKLDDIVTGSSLTKKIASVAKLWISIREKGSVLWHIIPYTCSPLKINWRFGATCRVLLQGRRISLARNQNAASSNRISARYLLQASSISVFAFAFMPSMCNVGYYSLVVFLHWHYTFRLNRPSSGVQVVLTKESAAYCKAVLLFLCSCHGLLLFKWVKQLFCRSR